MLKQLEILHSFMFLEMKCVLWVYLVMLLIYYLFKMRSYEKKLLSARFPVLVLATLDF